MFQYWCKYNYRVSDRINDSVIIENSNTWYNSNIKIASKILFWKTWYDKNIKHIIDLFNVSKARFYPWLEFKRKYDIKGNFLQFTSLVSAIPRQWKRILINKYSNDQEYIERIESITLSELLLSTYKPSSDIYKRYVDDANDQPSGQSRTINSQ